MSKPPTKLRWLIVPALLLAIGGGFWMWLTREIKPMPPGGSIYIRYENTTRMDLVLGDLHAKGVIRDARATKFYGWLLRHQTQVHPGTYQVRPGMTADQLFDSLTKPVRQLVRIPETNWAKRTAGWLQLHDVLNADDYLALVHSPQQFASTVTFPIPKDSLEGYLYPDTYDLPPLLGAKPVVERQLKAFERKVWEGLGKPKNLRRLITIASLVELEVAKDNERPIVAGVIENRLAKGIPLQIDATVLYARQKWGRLTHRQILGTESPYNTYLNKGLPPGPICSPSLKSIQAAIHPAKHNFLYYVAMPDGHQLFAQTLPEHEKNITKRKHALALLAKNVQSQKGTRIK